MSALHDSSPFEAISLDSYRWNFRKRWRRERATELRCRVQTRPNPVGAFTDAAQSPVPESPTFFKHLRFDTLASVANSQAKHGITVPNLGFDSTCVRVLISISHKFERRPTNIITNRWRQGPTLPLFN